MPERLARFEWLEALNLNQIVSKIQVEGYGVVFIHSTTILAPMFPGSVAGRMVDEFSFLTRWQNGIMAASFEIHGWLIGSCTDSGVSPMQVLYATIPIPGSQDLVYWGQITVLKGGLPDRLVEEIALATPMKIHKPDKRT